MNIKKPYMTVAKLKELLIERESHLLSKNHVESLKGVNIEKNYEYSPTMFKYFPNQSSFAVALFYKGLHEGFLPGLWYDHVGVVLQYLTAHGKVVRVLGQQSNREYSDYVPRDAMFNDNPLGYCSFDEVWFLIEMNDLFVIIEIDSDIKCSSFGILPVGTSESEAKAVFERIAAESMGQFDGVVSLEEADDRLSAPSDESNVLVELPVLPFQGKVKFPSVDRMIETYFDWWLEN